MRIHLPIIFLVGAVFLVGTASGQSKKFSWQDACFKNPGLPYCQGRDFAAKPPQPAKPPSPAAVKNPMPPSNRTANPTMVVVGGIDCRFADPLADQLIGLNFSRLSARPLVHNLVGQLASKRGLTDSDVQKIFDRLAGVDQAAVSVRDKRVVVMITGSVTNSALPGSDADLKVMPVSANVVLIGHPDAVDQAKSRMTAQGAPSELMRLAEQRQASADLWVIGSARSIGPEAVNAGLNRFSLTLSVQNQVTADLAFEFNGTPKADAVGAWPAILGAASIEGNAVHVRMSMEASEVEQKFGQLIDTPLGQRLAALVDGVRRLPAPEPPAPKSAKPIIWGLDGGPKEIN